MARWRRHQQSAQNAEEPRAVVDAGVTVADRDFSCSASASDAVVEDKVIRCAICLEDVGFSSDAGLPCGHGVCGDCAVSYLESKVDSGDVSADRLSCPIPACRLPIPDGDIARLLRATQEGSHVYARLLDLQAQRFIPDEGDGEQLVTCPSPGCGKVLVPSASVAAKEEIQCPTCFNLFCAGCGHPAHRGMECEEAELQRMDPALRKLLESENWTRCPICRNACERESGCNFMTCPSERCQGKTYFCYLCGELLTQADHAAHYEGFEEAVGREGAFGSVCRNRRVKTTADFALPTQPLPPEVSVVLGDEEGSLALRLKWREHKSDPPTIYYRVRLRPPGPHDKSEVKTFHCNAGKAYEDLKGLPKFRKYETVIEAVNVNGKSWPSEPSAVVYLHPRELAAQSTGSAAERRSRKWGKRDV